MNEFTIKAMSQKFGIEYVQAAAILKTLLESGKATISRKVKSSTGRGKPTSVYSVPDRVTIDFSKGEINVDANELLQQ